MAIARVRGPARYASVIAGEAGIFAVCGGVCARALPIPKEGPLGTISVRFNTWSEPGTQIITTQDMHATLLYKCMHAIAS